MLNTIVTITDQQHDTTTVKVDGTEVHILIQDQTILNGLDEEHEPDGGYSDTACGVYTLNEASLLHHALGLAIAEVQANKRAAR